MIIICDGYSAQNEAEQILVISLIDELKTALNQNQLIFIQDNEPKVLIEKLTLFYQEQIYMFANSYLIFDHEESIENELHSDPVELDGIAMTNYTFINSVDNILIQLSDVFISILRRYLQAIDSYGANIFQLIRNFNSQQKDNFTLLNRVLVDSLNFNPVFFHHIDSIENVMLFNRLILQYS